MRRISSMKFHHPLTLTKSENWFKFKDKREICWNGIPLWIKPETR